MGQLICILQSNSQTEAAHILDLLSANQIHCVVERETSEKRVPDLESGGFRQILVEADDQEKALRLLHETLPPDAAPQEYGEEVGEDPRHRILAWVAQRLHLKAKS